jgi:NAD(P)-dependent dehydrogenase (short-subunit alcohol dehydrogenase family)
MELTEGQTAVVTGAASGMGRAFAERFGALGMNVVLADVEEPRLVEVAAQMRESGANVLPVVTDVADGTAIDALAAKAFDTFGAVHVLCNNAGVGGGGPIAELTTNDWEWVLGVNLWGVIHGHRAFLPTMLASGEPGHIVNTASMAGMFAGPMMGPYNATKFAVVAITETLRAELEMTGANVSCSVLCPGFVNTDIMDSARNRPADLAGREMVVDEAQRAGFKAMLESGRQPAEVALMVERGIRENRLHIFTDEAMGALFEQRAQRILAEFKRVDA